MIILVFLIVEVDLLETNVVTSNKGIRFTQVIAWDKGKDFAIDRGYKVVKKGYPSVHRYGDTFRCVYFTDSKVYIMKSKQHLITRTPYDREARFREFGGVFRPCW